MMGQTCPRHPGLRLLRQDSVPRKAGQEAMALAREHTHCCLGDRASRKQEESEGPAGSELPPWDSVPPKPRDPHAGPWTPWVPVA